MEPTNIQCDKLLACVSWGLDCIRACFNPFYVGLGHDYSAVKIIKQLTSTYLQPQDISPLKCYCVYVHKTQKIAYVLVTGKFSKCAITEIFELTSSYNDSKRSNNTKYEVRSRQTGTFNFTGGGTTHSSKWQVCPITDRWRTCRGPVQRPLIKMADNSGSVCMEQRVVIKFLVNEGVKPADIYRRLQAQ